MPDNTLLSTAAWSLLLIAILAGCSTSSIVDEQRSDTASLELSSGERLVIMGRRHGNSYETEPDFINCISNNVANTGKFSVMPEQEFLDTLYPWFEPRVAPLKLQGMGKTLAITVVADRIKAIGIRYVIWVDGSTETTEEKGSMHCGMAPSGGCFGFKSWDKTSSYEATIWDLKHLTEKGKVKVDSKGASYMLGIIAPIPLIAQVKGVACEDISSQLKGFFSQ